MTNNNIELGIPDYEIIVRQKNVKNEMYPFDIVVHFDKDMNIQFIADEDMLQVIKEFVKQHGEIYIKTNWFSDDLHVFKGLHNTPTTQQEPRRGTKRTKPIST